MMSCEIREIVESDRRPVIEVFNYYINNSFAAYPQEPVTDEFFDNFLHSACTYPAVAVVDSAADGAVVGFGLMRPCNPFSTFARSVEIGYFLGPGYTRRGIGTMLLEFFIAQAKNRGIDCILAGCSSLNQAGINFHVKAGFSVCGRFNRMGRKFGKDFDVVWMQRLL
jgi:phosphinothricin acetyltransferase